MLVLLGLMFFFLSISARPIVPFVLHGIICGSEKNTIKLIRPIPTNIRFRVTELGEWGPFKLGKTLFKMT